MRTAASYRLSRWLFLRLVGVVLLIAFVSLWVQVVGLVGERGLLPLGEHLERLRQARGDTAWLDWPMLFWIGHGDAWLHAVCAAGVVAAMLLIAGVAQLPMLFASWLLYLSLTLAGQSFTSFQWDILLLEACFTATFVAPGTWRPRRPFDEPVPSRAGLWLVRLLLFKLMFLSGAVKLLSMDPAWWKLEALDVHYFTQPLPPWTAWYAQQLPVPFQRFSVLVMFAIEIVLPFAIFCGRIASRVAGVGIAFLMGMIALTGNYNFFNLLTVVLCILLFDDELLARVLPSRIRGVGDSATVPAASPARRIAGALRIAAASALVLVSLLTFVRELVRTAPERMPGATGWLLASGEKWLLGWGSPRVLAYTDRFHTISGYGLFRSMTTERPEIVIEGSADGIEWREYGFRWKPGDPFARPRFVEPHQPRLDWQMWFAALAPERQRPWLETLMRRLLEGEPTVLQLMGHNPFEQEPPRYVRLVYYAYTFTDRAERRRSGAWWKRIQRGLLTPRPLSLDDFTR